MSGAVRTRLGVRNCRVPARQERGSTMRMWKRCAGASAAAIGLCCFWAFFAGPAARAQDKPMYKVDPYWPKPLPNKWIMQQVPTLAVDKDDHIWVLNRSRQIMPDETGA